MPENEFGGLTAYQIVAAFTRAMLAGGCEQLSIREMKTRLNNAGISDKNIAMYPASPPRVVAPPKQTFEDITLNDARRFVRELQAFCYKDENGDWEPDKPVSGAAAVDLICGWLSEQGLAPIEY